MSRQATTTKRRQILRHLTARERLALYLVIALLLWGACVRLWRTQAAKPVKSAPAVSATTVSPEH